MTSVISRDDSWLREFQTLLERERASLTSSAGVPEDQALVFPEGDALPADAQLGYLDPDQLAEEARFHEFREVLLSILRERVRILLALSPRDRDTLLLEMRKELAALSVQGDLYTLEWVIGSIRELAKA